MAQAIAIATQAGDGCAPNPRVGCVLVGVDGKLIGTGQTQKAGGPHAEIMALRDAADKGHSTYGATAYVTLEPCSHFGRTGPCCDALVAAGIKRVFASVEDPNPKVSGNGFRKLRAAGVEVEVGSHAAEAQDINIGFFSRMIRKRPWVRMKVAASIDGYTALPNGLSQWITSEAARIDGHTWRARAGAVLSGIGTVKADNPRLDVRLVKTERQPHVVVVDSKLELSPNALLFITGRTVLIYAAVQDDEKKTKLEAAGAVVVHCPGRQPGTEHKVDLAAMFDDLAIREINDVHVEAGSKLNGSLLQADLIDEAIIYLAPKWIGAGQGMAALAPLTSLASAIPMKFRSIDTVGTDIRIVARLEGRGL